MSRRTHEIGIRRAIGARPGQVLRGVLGGGMFLVAIGVAVGLAASLLATRWLEAMLFEVGKRDLATYAAMVLGVGAVGLLANFVPARRASRVDPMRALRTE